MFISRAKGLTNNSEWGIKIMRLHTPVPLAYEIHVAKIYYESEE